MTFDLKITNAHAYSILAYAFVASYGQVYYSEPEVCTSLAVPAPRIDGGSGDKAIHMFVLAATIVAVQSNCSA